MVQGDHLKPASLVLKLLRKPPFVSWKQLMDDRDQEKNKNKTGNDYFMCHFTHLLILKVLTYSSSIIKSRCLGIILHYLPYL